ncbi:hypothetical protein GW17_00015894 [Ensete ventricosum]|nr:hypothetical protein GW17_00015894 [Ensete ventricosum]
MTDRYKDGTPRALQGGSRAGTLPLPLYFNQRREEAPAPKEEMPDFILLNYSNLIVRGTSPGTHHPGGLVLQEHFDEVRKICIKDTTRASTRVDLELPAWSTSCAPGSNPVVQTH